MKIELDNEGMGFALDEYLKEMRKENLEENDCNLATEETQKGVSMKNCTEEIVWEKNGKTVIMTNRSRYHITTTQDIHCYFRPSYIRESRDPEKAILVGNVKKTRRFIKMKDIEDIRKVD